MVNIYKYKYMYSIGYKKPDSAYTSLGWHGGNTEEEATDKALKEAVEFHNKYNENKLEVKDLTVVECKLSGDYETVLKELQRG